MARPVRRACIGVVAAALLSVAPAAAMAGHRDERTGRISGATSPAPGQNAPGQSSTGAARTERGGTHVTVADLENSPSKYVGQRISVDAEVAGVTGPRMFTIDEPNSAHLVGETMVALPIPLAGLLEQRDRVSIEGTLEPLVAADFSRKWGWLRLTPEIEETLANKPVLVADRIFGGNDQRTPIIDASTASRPVATTASADTGDPVISLGTLAHGTDRLVGRMVHLSSATIDRTQQNGGFFIREGSTRVFVLPALPPVSPITTGNTVSIDGVVRDMPRQMASQFTGSGLNDAIYVYALGVRQ